MRIPSPRRPSRRFRAGALTALALWTTGAAPAAMTQCDVHVMTAYLTAKSRGWKFGCGAASLSVNATFATYPPDRIGCQFATPPVWPPGHKLGFGYLFDGSTGGKTLKNGWILYGFDVAGVQWNKAPISYHILVDFEAFGNYANHVHHARLTRLTLVKPNGSCSKAIDEAF